MHDKKDILIDIGKRIHDARIDNKMSQEDLAFASNTSTSTISDIESGKTNLRVITLINIVEALGVSADSILRADTPEVNYIYQKEFSDLLCDCSPSELESIKNLIINIKSAFHKNS